MENTHIKIQYHNEELTVQEICERLERAEKKALDGWNTLDSLLSWKNANNALQENIAVNMKTVNRGENDG